MTIAKTEPKKLARWEKPELASVGIELVDVRTQYNAGTDALMFGLSTSMS